MTSQAGGAVEGLSVDDDAVGAALLPRVAALLRQGRRQQEQQEEEHRRMHASQCIMSAGRLHGIKHVDLRIGGVDPGVQQRRPEWRRVYWG